MNKKIFIGGTGRSGTTILSKLLGTHKEIYKIPFETRFIIDKGGLLDLFYSLTVNYSFDQARISIRDFKNLMLNYFVNPFISPYLGLNYYKFFGKEFYLNQFESFFNKLVLGDFVASDYHSIDKENLINFFPFIRKKFGKLHKYWRIINKKIFNKKYETPPLWPKEEMYIGKYFSDNNELCTIIGEFINNLFTYKANENNKLHWCEDTPANILHIDFLNKLFNETYFIHIIRHPIGIAWSLRKQFWAPNDLENNINLLSNLFEKIIKTKEYILASNPNFLEIKLEDLAYNFNKELESIVHFLKIKNEFICPPLIEPQKVNYYQNEIPENEKRILELKLAKYIDYFNY